MTNPKRPSRDIFTRRKHTRRKLHMCDGQLYRPCACTQPRTSHTKTINKLKAPENLQPQLSQPAWYQLGL